MKQRDEMTEDEAVVIANEYIVQRSGLHFVLGDISYQYQLIGARFSQKKYWAVLYHIAPIDAPENTMEGPVIVTVDPITRVAKFLDEMY